MDQKFDALILGGGAAGLMCAAEAGKRGRHVAVIEHADRPGKKILISGGGRCNFTNTYCQPENFLSANPHFVKSALARYTPADFIALVEKHRIPYHEKAAGQLFCDRSAEDILKMLETECAAGGVQIFSRTTINEVERAAEFVVRADSGVFRAPTLVVATGGLSIPKMGATGFGYEVARKFGLKIRQTRPALVPFVLGVNDRNQYCDLAGVSAEVAVSTDDHAFRDKMLFTHRGLSGPAILQISSYWNAGEPICIDLAPGRDLAAAIGEGQTRNAAAVRLALQGFLPHRFAKRWVDLHTPAAWNNPARRHWIGRRMNGFSSRKARRVMKKPR
jgi:predicted Rossmann fold flavoprotein